MSYSCGKKNTASVRGLEKINDEVVELKDRRDGSCFVNS